MFHSISVEDPSVDFVRLRDFVDVNNGLELVKSFADPEVVKAGFSEVMAKVKVFSLNLLSGIPANTLKKFFIILLALFLYANFSNTNLLTSKLRVDTAGLISFISCVKWRYWR